MKTPHILFVGIGAVLTIYACDMPSSFSCKEDRTCWPVGGTGGTEGGGTNSSGTTNRGGASSNGGSGGTTSSGTTAPCNGKCSGTTAVCDTAANKCVECVKKTDCTAAPKSVCNGSNACVECVASTDCTANATKTVCNTTTSACVGCLGNTDCKDATASLCNTSTNACSPCTVDADCGAISGKGVCSAGTCVQCTVDKETACGANSCNPSTKTCTATARGTRDYCQTCLADSECIGGNLATPTARCVPMTYGAASEAHGAYCLQVATVVNCTSPFKVNIVAKSLSGTDGTYCGINQAATTCEAVNDLIASKACTQADSTTECGGGKGGLCKNFSLTTTPDLRCTIPCSLTSDCAGTLVCTSALPYCH
jgi:hypothetical protein